MVNGKVLGILNGVVGDYLVQQDNALAIAMDFYHKNEKLNGNIASAEQDHPDWNGNVCLFIHGSADSESRWTQKDSLQYGNEIYNTFNALPLYLRYNSGLHISENGKLLAKSLEYYLSNNDINQVAVVGHSMGGLIFRSACYYAELHQHSWINKIVTTFYLGSPHYGAPLEKFGAWAQSVLDKFNFSSTNAISKLINIRSNGIKDLRHGYLIDEEWLHDHVDDFPKNRKVHLPLTDIENSYVVAATIHENTDALISHWFGDIMVRKNSAMGECKKTGYNLNFPVDNTLVLGGVAHIKLANNPHVESFLLKKLENYFYIFR